MLLSKSNLQVVKVASREPVKKGLNGVRIEPDGSTVGGNGKVFMAVSPVDEVKVGKVFPEVGERVGVGDLGVVAPVDLIQDVIKIIPKDRRVVLQHAALTKDRVDPDKLEFTTTDTRKAKRVSQFPKPDRYQDWKAVAKTVRGDGQGFRMCVNRKDLMNLLDAMEAACPDKGGQNQIFIEAGTGVNGLLFRSENYENGQRAMGMMTGYKVGEYWMELSEWEEGVLLKERPVAKKVAGRRKK